MDSSDQQALTTGVVRRLGLDVGTLWLAHVALGGSASEQQIGDYCRGTGSLRQPDRDAVSQAVNEWESGTAVSLRAPYSFSQLTT